MINFLFLLIFICSILSVESFSRLPSSNSIIKARNSFRMGLKAPQPASMVEEVPQCLNGMVLVERIIKPESTDSGLYVNREKAKDKVLLARIVAIPDGLLQDNGFLCNKEEYFPYKVGDLVFIDNYSFDAQNELKTKPPNSRYYSYHKPWYFTAVVNDKETETEGKTGSVQ